MRILFAADLSEPPAVTQQVEALVQRVEGELLVLHVHVPTVTPAIAPVDPMTGLTGFAAFSAYDPATQAELERLEHQAFRTFLTKHFRHPVRAALREGEAYRVILEDAAAQQVDMIVLGKRHHSKLQQFLVGSTAEKVLHRTRLPVLLLPLPKHD